MLALPGVLTLLSVLAVLLGTPAPLHEPRPQVKASPVSPVTPELAPLTSSGPGPGLLLLAAPPPPPFIPQSAIVRRAAGQVSRSAPFFPLELSVLGRRQTDGG